MKKLGISKKLALGFSLVAAMNLLNASVPNPGAQQAGKAEVRAIRGSAKYAQNGSEWTPLKVGTVLKSGSTIQTGQESNVDLFLGKNGPVVRVTSNTTLSLDKLTFTETGAETVIDTQLNLRAGRILGYVEKTSSLSTYEVKTPAGIAGIRGTWFDMMADGTLAVIRSLTPSVMAFIDPGTGNVGTQTVGEGQTFRPGGTLQQIPQETLNALIEVFRQLIVLPPPPRRGGDNPPPRAEEDEPHVSGQTGLEAD